eukprot:CAMPEP_0196581814 /NCGR_PEP_ID=MMETSP1081-20130531/35806_1 /TAXON_ID=36882 /ORGANISM="Pyramimonas amylifera, Strain CCMP720" /LENGTH=146 /DNA_ID=CAMNT_0041902181 /DNA_START=251 /DNA_END=691 /DNA_ORIENTATION=-
MHSYENGHSTATKTNNWQQIEKALSRNGINIPRPMIEGTMKGSHGGSQDLMEGLFQTLTGKILPERVDATQVEFIPFGQKVQARTKPPTPANISTMLKGGPTAGSKVLHESNSKSPVVFTSSVSQSPLEVDPMKLRQQIARANMSR